MGKKVLITETILRDDFFEEEYRHYFVGENL